ASGTCPGAGRWCRAVGLGGGVERHGWRETRPAGAALAVPRPAPPPDPNHVTCFSSSTPRGGLTRSPSLLDSRLHHHVQHVRLRGRIRRRIGHLEAVHPQYVAGAGLVGVALDAVVEVLERARLALLQSLV